MKTQTKIDTTRIIGDTISRNWGETYIAPSDGILTARANGALSATSNNSWVKISTGDIASLTFRLGDGYTGNPQALFASVTYPIKKGEYYKVDKYSSNGSTYFQAFFTPLI